MTTKRHLGKAIFGINPSDRSWTRHSYVLWFGAYGTTRLLVYGNDLEAALETCGEWLAEHAPGLIASVEEMGVLQAEAAAELGIAWPPVKISWDDPQVQAVAEAAETDMTYTEAGWIPSHEWGILCVEDPSLEELRDLIRHIDVLRGR